jgi:hypothetical protein
MICAEPCLPSYYFKPWWLFIYLATAMPHGFVSLPFHTKSQCEHMIDAVPQYAPVMRHQLCIVPMLKMLTSKDLR